MEGRDFVIPDDVKRFAIDALAHRVVVKAEYSFEGIGGEEIIRKALQNTPVPKESEE
jgi:MoxR-like ATPase